jgi:cytochrome c biogenesis protein CcmG/thiol:disulfide interchange protein DsbE
MSNDRSGGKPVGRLATARTAKGAGPGGSRRPGASSSALPLIILALVAGLGIGVAIGWFAGHSTQEAAPTTAATTTTGGTDTTADPGTAYGVVTVSGDALPVFESGSPDTGIGLPIPEISGVDFAGDPQVIAADGRAKLIVGLAHWCPYCRQELPVLSEWYASADLPADVEVFLVTVFTASDRDNYPPGPWLAEEGWSGPVLADDQTGSIAAALGIASVPYNLFVAPDGTVVARTTGGRSADQLNADIEYLASLSAEGTTTP